MHSKGYADSEAEKKEDTESKARLKNDQQPIKLQNSQVLNDLSTNLSHLTLQHIVSWQGYWQVPLTQRAREMSAFVTPSGLYQYKVMLFGMQNTPATFQRMGNKLV